MITACFNSNLNYDYKKAFLLTKWNNAFIAIVYIKTYMTYYSQVFFFQNADIESEAVDTSKKIDIQVASLKTLLESLKLETIRYLAGMYPRCFSNRWYLSLRIFDLAVTCLQVLQIRHWISWRTKWMNQVFC